MKFVDCQDHRHFFSGDCGFCGLIDTRKQDIVEKPFLLRLRLSNGYAYGTVWVTRTLFVRLIANVGVMITTAYELA
jgi:hypothetical protein